MNVTQQELVLESDRAPTPSSLDLQVSNHYPVGNCSCR